MAAYVIGHFTVHDRETYMKYASQTSESIAQFGGEFLVKAGQHEWLEGAGRDRHVIFRFADMDTARRWYASDSYKQIEPLRLASSEGELLLIEGL